MVRRIVVIASFAESLSIFRGKFIHALLASGTEVNVAAPGALGVRPPLGALGCERVQLHELDLQRTGTNPVSDIWHARVPHRYALVAGLNYAFTGTRQGLVTRLVRILYLFALRRTHKVFFQNPDDERLLRQRGLLPSNIPSVVVNGSGVDIAKFSVHALPVGPPVFLMIPRLLGDKGVREYVQAARIVRKITKKRDSCWLVELIRTRTLFVSMN